MSWWTRHRAERAAAQARMLPEAERLQQFLRFSAPFGLEFLDRLRDHPEWGRIPVLVVTAKTLSADERTRLNRDVGRILQKGSYTREEFLAEVGTLVGSAARRPPYPS